MTSPRPTGARALVLGGGGLAGIAWEVGVLVGLAEAGVDVTDADRVVGTSAGSVVGTLLATGVDLVRVHAEHCDGAAAAGSGTGRERSAPAPLDMEEMGRAFAAAAEGARDLAEMRARLGAWALTASSVPEQDRLDVIAGRLPVQVWPERDLRVTAVDTASGELTVFDRDAGVDLVAAVAASCAVPGVWPPVTVAGRRYMDGGMRSVVNLDLADTPDPAARVLVIAPLDPAPGGPFPSVAEEVRRRRDGGADTDGTATTLVVADEGALAAFGADVLDPACMPGAAVEGRRQGAEAADVVAATWSP